jgi:hypothetical protein
MRCETELGQGVRWQDCSGVLFPMRHACADSAGVCSDLKRMAADLCPLQSALDAHVLPAHRASLANGDAA